MYVLFLSASAPTRTLGRRKLVRNRFTIDTDIVFDGDPDQNDLTSPPESNSRKLQQKTESSDEQQQQSEEGDTDRWVEEQFDLEEYEDQEDMKETDILSDEDEEFCQAPKAQSEDLEAPMKALSLEGAEEVESESLKSPSLSDTHDDDEKLSDMEEGDATDDTEDQKDEVWVRREPSGSSQDWSA